MDINDQIAANLGLVYQQLSRFKLATDPDAESYAYEALYKAILTYDKSAGNAFSTYAVCVISNALRKHLRTLHKKRQLYVMSYDTPLTDECDTFTIVDTLMHAEDTESTVLFKELSAEVEKAFNKVYSGLSDLHKKIIAIWYDADCKISQREIADAMHVSQPAVSRAISLFKHKLKMELEDYV